MKFFRRLKQGRSFGLQRFLVFLLASIATVLLGVSIAQTRQPVTVTALIQAGEASQLQPLIQEFHQKHPEIRLNLIEGPNATDAVEDLYTSSFILGDSPYDLVYMDVVWVPKFAAAGWLVDLSDRFSSEKRVEFLDGDIEAGMYQGKLYRIPLRSDVGMLYYRTDLLAKAGYSPPETFKDLLTLSQQLQQQGMARWGFLWQGGQYEGLAAVFVEVLAGSDAFWIDPQTLEVGLDRPEAIEAVEFLRSTLKEGISPPGVTTYAEQETLSLYQSGNTVFLRSWPYVFGLVEGTPIEGKIAIRPMVHLPGQNSGACQGGWGFGIARSSKHLNAAWKVIEFFTSKDVQRQYILSTGFVPSRRSLFNDPQIVAKYEHYPQLLEVAEQAILRPPIAQYSQASDILQRYLSAALTNRMSPEQAMQKAADETRRLLERG